jgi:anion-transporting  ArsA/GET3 family ATPase
MFKNFFKSTNVKKMEDQIAQLREDVTSLQAQLNELINKNHIRDNVQPTIDNVQPTIDNVLLLENVLEPRIKDELVAVVIDPASILENPTTHGLESLIMKEPFDLLDNIIEKVLDEVSNKVENVADKVLDEVKNIADKVLDKVENVAEKVLEQVPTVEKETNTLPPKKRRQSKKATHAEVHCLEPCI